MDISRALTFVFRDPAWREKAGIALVLTLLPGFLSGAATEGGTLRLGLLALAFGLISLATSILVLGYGLRIARQVTAGVDLPLPTWTDWGGLAFLGLKGVVVGLAWFLIPIVLAAAVWIGAIAGAGDGGAAGLALLLSCLTLLLFLALAVMLPAALTRTAATGSLGEGVNVPAVFALVRANLGDYLLLLVLWIAVGIAAALVGVVLGLLVGAIFGGSEAGTWLRLTVTGLLNAVFQLYFGAAIFHLYGQAYYRANRGPVLPPGATYGQLN